MPNYYQQAAKAREQQHTVDELYRLLSTTRSELATALSLVEELQKENEELKYQLAWRMNDNELD